ncbi:MAG TPA: pitrilysin family protein [Thermoanaerobaculia bacterium]|nr:pitrilysin family protein [Thermoanaerobaculia bacterium]
MSAHCSLLSFVLALACAGALPLSMAAQEAAPTPAPGEVQRVTVPVPNAPTRPGTPAIELVTLPSPQSPIVAIRAFFRTGSIDDPAGKEGLANLTASVVGEGATAKRSYKELVDALYPLAASIDAQVDREVTVFSVVVHREKLDEATALLAEVLTQPGFNENDLERHRKDALSYLTTTLRASNDELLGLEALQEQVYAGHPYAHPDAGTVKGLGAITLDDVKRFYREHYTTGNLWLGIAGGYPEDYPGKLAQALVSLPMGRATMRELPAVAPPTGRELLLISKEAASTGIHFGFPLPITRADPDYYPLMVANSYLGEHRTFNGRLQNELRGKRGLNYGNYSYVEYYAAPPFTTNPTPNVPRREQYFSVWIRPVQPENAQFALRAAVHEVQQLAEHGMSKEDFELTRDYLTSYSKLWAQTLSRRLGFLLDSKFYGTPYYIDEIGRRLATMTVDDVNRAAKKYLQTERWEGVIVAGDAEALKAKLEADAPSPITYANAVPPDVTAADPMIAKLPVKPTKVEVVPVAEMFEK